MMLIPDAALFCAGLLTLWRGWPAAAAAAAAAFSSFSSSSSCPQCFAWLASSGPGAASCFLTVLHEQSAYRQTHKTRPSVSILENRGPSLHTRLEIKPRSSSSCCSPKTTAACRTGGSQAAARAFLGTLSVCTEVYMYYQHSAGGVCSLSHKAVSEIGWSAARLVGWLVGWLVLRGKEYFLIYI
ncbi:hypothetical protein BD289DRAFT_448434 [Coniella lustricola]|uniref:Secreted protein n=1 Tax=Coniella lustricola TaxID=2025994 RepID=A0A2T2ZS65_9PEZI|nr:hypothetical protein BD289DRAFT_448434 [Coniella lustricola]